MKVIRVELDGNKVEMTFQNPRIKGKKRDGGPYRDHVRVIQVPMIDGQRDDAALDQIEEDLVRGIGVKMDLEAGRVMEESEQDDDSTEEQPEASAEAGEEEGPGDSQP